MFDWLFDVYQQGKIAETQAANAESRARITGLTEEALSLEMRYERLRLVTIAMWTLLKEHSGLTEEDLRKYVMHVDLIDGKADGKLSRSTGIIPCPSCHRKIIRSSLACVYCGEKNSRGDSFHGT